MEEKKNNKVIWITGAIILIVILVILTPDLLDSKKELDTAKLEYNLIQEGKTTSSNEIINEIIEILKNRDEENLKNYLTEDFSYINDDRYESKYVSELWNNLKYLVENSYEVEKRGNSIKDEETYIIYWNTNKTVKERTDRLYCLQKISIYLRKIVKQDEVTYQIYKIMLTDN